MCLDVLDNRQWYRPISKTLVENFTREYYGLIFKAYQQGTIDLNTWSYLNVKDPKTPTFYSLPKVHKSLEHPPGRPIVSGCQGLTKNASALVDKYLYPHVTSLFSYVKDTIDLLQNIDGKQIPCNTWLVAVDVESLYNSIPHMSGKSSARYSCRSQAHSCVQVPTKNTQSSHGHISERACANATTRSCTRVRACYQNWCNTAYLYAASELANCCLVYRVT